MRTPATSAICLTVLDVPVLSEMANAEQWRKLYQEALDGFDPVLQETLIVKARTAIFDRLLDLCDLSGSHQDEEKLLEEALRQLWIAENRKPN